MNVDEMLEWFASFGQSDSQGVTRLLYSSAWIEAQNAIKEKMEEMNLVPSFDRVGNLFGKLQGTEPNTKTILIGSHIDTVVNGGKYDGAYGIAAGLIAVHRLYQQYGLPKKTIEVVSLCEEEGSRFPFTFWGSKNITGKCTIDDINAITDSDGISFLDAMKSAGFDPSSYAPPIRNDLACFLELHIEQGKILETTTNSLGMVSHIVGQRRFDIEIIGEPNHAGTTPMHLRKDAMNTAGFLISFINGKAKEIDPQLVATVGKLLATPNVVNVIAGEVKMTLDVRHHEETVLDQYCTELYDYIDRLAAEEGIDISITKWMDAKPIKMDESLTALAKSIATEQKLSFQPMVSGAGHDAQIFAEHCPTSLIFVPSKNGISHSPLEFTKKEDLENGVEILTNLLHRLAY